MRKSNFSEDFKRDALRQMTARGYPVAEVCQRLGVSQHLLYDWQKRFGASIGRPATKPKRSGERRNWLLLSSRRMLPWHQA